MKKVLRVLLFSLVLCILVASSALAKQATAFNLEKFKMKLGDVQALSGVLNGDYDLDKVDSSNPDVVEILSNGRLKAKATGISTLTYTYQVNGNDKTVYCYVEVTRYDATYDQINGSTKKEIIYITLETGDSTIKMESSYGAIPKLPTVSKTGYILEGWYTESTYTNKVTDKLRFYKDSTIYAKWITEEEAKAQTITASELYDDIDGHWARVAIDSVSYKGLFQGVAERTFGPEIPMTRAMAVAVLGRLESTLTNKDISSEGLKLDVADVNSSSYYAPQLAWAMENKIVTDVNDGKFRPNDEITREEIAVYMANYLNYKKYKISTILSASYNDISELSKASQEAIDLLYNANIMQGVGGNSFAPASSTTRAQMAQIFYNLYNFTMKYKG